MKIALTGSSGKLGRTVARELCAAGYTVIGMDIKGERGPDFVELDFRGTGCSLGCGNFPQQYDRHIQCLLGGYSPWY